jgi:effector-binding domain-containing protein
LTFRGTIKVADLGPTMGDRLAALRAYLQQSGAKPAGPPIVRYHTFGETETDFEIDVPVVKPVVGEGRIEAGELPGGPALTTWHVGAHDKLGEAYARIQSYLEEHGYEPGGPAREVYYWIDLGKEDDPSALGLSAGRTQLIQPVK